MGSAFIMSIVEWWRFGGRLARALPYAGWGKIPLRLVLFTGIWLLSGLLTALHWLGFTLDEVLFRGYRRVALEKPVFILGVPRSGTTWLQRVMACDPNLTSLTLWECVLAPSISERYFWRGAGYLGKPLAWLLRRLPVSPLSHFDKIHKLRLDEPEEDFLLLAPLHACFLWVFLCPNATHYWHLTRFDEQVPDAERSTIMRFYRRCLQKHVYYHGRDKQILSKNPSFTPFVESLQREFPGGRFIACIRSPHDAVPSQLSSVLPSAQFLGIKQLDEDFKQRMLMQLQHYYEIIRRRVNVANTAIVDMTELTDNLGETVRALYRHLSVTLTPEFEQVLSRHDHRGREYRSRHRYDLQRFNLSTEQISWQFSDCWPIQTMMNSVNLSK